MSSRSKDQKLTPTTIWFHISSPKSASISLSMCCKEASSLISVPFITSRRVFADFTESIDFIRELKNVFYDSNVPKNINLLLLNS